MNATTLAIVNAPTLQDGLVELLRIGDALQLAGADCGVSCTRDSSGRLLDAEADYDVPAGVLEYTTRGPVVVWPGAPDLNAELARQEERRQLVEALHQHTDADVLVVSGRLVWL